MKVIKTIGNRLRYRQSAVRFSDKVLRGQGSRSLSDFSDQMSFLLFPFKIGFSVFAEKTKKINLALQCIARIQSLEKQSACSRDDFSKCK